MEKLHLKVFTIKFVDDTKGQKEIRGVEDGRKMREALDTLCHWAEKLIMQFNPDKTGSNGREGRGSLDYKVVKTNCAMPKSSHTQKGGTKPTCQALPL
jgi:hypothetical protein